MKLTDEKVAKALGWKRMKGRTISRTTSIYWTFPGAGRGRSQKQPPHFTTSLDAIVAEIEAWELAWFVQNNASEEGVNEEYFAEVDNQRFSAHASSAPLALCAVLLQFLKESNRG